MKLPADLDSRRAETKMTELAEITVVTEIKKEIYWKQNLPCSVEYKWDKCQYNDYLPRNISTGFGSASGSFR